MSNEFSLVDLRHSKNICNNNCPLLNKRTNEFVPFEIHGDRSKLKMLCVGESPADPKSEKLLKDTLRSLGITDYAIGNIICCQSKNEHGSNRTPESEELDYCKTHILEFIKSLNPKVVILLGGTAAKSLIPLSVEEMSVTTMTKLPIQEVDGIKYSVNFHPNYLVRNGGQSSTIYSEFLQKFKVLHEKSEKSESIYTYDHFSALKNDLSYWYSYDNVAFDVEASGELWTPKYHVIGFSLACRDSSKYYEIPRGYTFPEKDLNLYLNFLQDKKPWTYNAKYEMNAIWTLHGKSIQFNDSMVLCTIDGRPISLKKNARYYLGSDVWEEDFWNLVGQFQFIFDTYPLLREKCQEAFVAIMSGNFNLLEGLLKKKPKKIQKIDTAIKFLLSKLSKEEVLLGLRKYPYAIESIPVHITSKYCCLDSINTLKLKEELWPKFGKYYKYYIAQTWLAGTMEAFGTNWDDNKASELDIYYLTEANECLSSLMQYLVFTKLDDVRDEDNEIIKVPALDKNGKKVIYKNGKTKMVNKKETVGCTDEYRLLSKEIIASDDTLIDQLTQLKKLFNPMSNKKEAQDPFWKVYRNDYTTALSTFQYFKNEFGLLPAEIQKEAVKLLNRFDLNETINNLYEFGDTINNNYQRTKFIKILGGLQRAWDDHFQRFAEEILGFHYNSHINFGGTKRFRCTACKFTVDENDSTYDNVDKCPNCEDKGTWGSGLDIDNRDTWTDEFYMLYYLKRFKKVNKARSTYVEGKIGRVNVRSAELDKDMTVPPMRQTIYKELQESNTLKSDTPLILNTSFRENAAITKRWRSPHHTVPPNCELREIYTPRDNNSCTLHYDYSQFEVICIAALANEQNLLNAFEQGKDIHRYVASKIFKVPEDEVTKTQRKYAKNATFSLLYGKGEETMATDLFGGDLQAAKQLFADFFAAFPGIKDFVTRMHESYLTKGWVPTIFGDPIYIEAFKEHEALRQAQNYPVQSSASNIAGYTAWILYDRIRRLGLKAIPLCFTHDSIDWEIHMPHLFPFIKLMKMVSVDFIKKTFNVPAKIDWEIGIHQQAMMELEETSFKNNIIACNFSCESTTFKQIVNKLSQCYELEYEIEKEKDKYQSLEELFLPKRAFSRYYGTSSKVYEGEIKFKLK